MIRTFDTGATRDNDEGKIDYEALLSPRVLRRYGKYMALHATQSDGTIRSFDNWQLGIPMDQYMKSMFRHFMDVWEIHRGCNNASIDDALCALLFNVMGMLHEELKRCDSLRK